MTTDPILDAGPRRVLVAIDGSASADAAVDLTASLPWPAGTAIRVIEAVDLGPGLFGGPWPSLALVQADELQAVVRDEARREVADARDRLDAPDRVLTAAVIDGRPASVIVEEARAMPADLVVIGNRGHGTIASMLLGSVSSEVIDHAPAPVLVARGPSLARVVLAWDGSTGSTLAADAIRTWPVLAHADVRVVTVANVGPVWWGGLGDAGAPGGVDTAAVLAEAEDAARDAATRHAEEMAATLRAAGLAATAEPRGGDAATEIIAAARDAGADLIVMGTHGRTGLARLALGSVATNVLHHAPCSVLVIREAAAP